VSLGGVNNTSSRIVSIPPFSAFYAWYCQTGARFFSAAPPALPVRLLLSPCLVSKRLSSGRMNVTFAQNVTLLGYGRLVLGRIGPVGWSVGEGNRKNGTNEKNGDGKWEKLPVNAPTHFSHSSHFPIALANRPADRPDPRQHQPSVTRVFFYLLTHCMRGNGHALTAQLHTNLASLILPHPVAKIFL